MTAGAAGVMRRKVVQSPVSANSSDDRAWGRRGRSDRLHPKLTVRAASLTGLALAGAILTAIVSLYGRGTSSSMANAIGGSAPRRSLSRRMPRSRYCQHNWAGGANRNRIFDECRRTFSLQRSELQDDQNDE